MPPKAQPKEDKPERKGPPPKYKTYVDEPTFDKETQVLMLALKEKATPVSKDGGKKDAKAADTKPEEIQYAFKKEECRQYVEGVTASWQEDEDWEKTFAEIPKMLDADGKQLETVSEDGLREWAKALAFSGGVITQPRLDAALLKAPVSQKFERYETSILDFVQSDLFSDITILNRKTNASYK